MYAGGPPLRAQLRTKEIILVKASSTASCSVLMTLAIMLQPQACEWYFCRLPIPLMKRLKTTTTVKARARALSLQNRPLRIVVGASGVFEPGWIPTEISFLNLLRPKDWAKYFSPGSVDAILAEHVWEHLTRSDGIQAARTCYYYLRRGGYLRVAVPDGNHPDPNYIDWVRPGGIGPGACDHKMLYDYQTLGALFNAVGFDISLLEYFDCEGKFHYVRWHRRDGMVHRSSRFDIRNKKRQLSYTSLILDAIKARN